jgi:hypothetical protein
MKYLRLASVAALVGAAAVSASPLGARGDDTCPKGYTASVYYKTIYFESSTTATPIESTVIPSPTPVVVSSQVSAIEQVQTSTSSSIESAVEASSTKAAQLVALLPTSSVEVVAAVETTSAPQIQTLVQQTTTQAAAETTTAPVVQAIVQQTTSTASTAETTAAPVVQAISEQTASTTEAAAATTTAAAVVKVPQATSSSSSSNSGEATFYGGNVSGGTCSFSGYSLPSTLFGTALSLDRWDSSANCGRCVSVTGPKGNTVKAMVIHLSHTPSQSPNYTKTNSNNTRLSTNAPNAKATTSISSRMPSPSSPISQPVSSTSTGPMFHVTLTVP